MNSLSHSFPNIRRVTPAPAPANHDAPLNSGIGESLMSINVGMYANGSHKRARVESHSPIETPTKRQRTDGKGTHPYSVSEASSAQNTISNLGNAELNILLLALDDFISKNKCDIKNRVEASDELVRDIEHLFGQARAVHNDANSTNQIASQQLVQLALQVGKLREINGSKRQNSCSQFSEFFSCLNQFLRNESTLTLSTMQIASMMLFFHNKQPSEGAIALLITLVDKLRHCESFIDAHKVSVAVRGMHDFQESDFAYDLLDVLWSKVDHEEGVTNPVSMKDVELGLFGLKLYSSKKRESVDLLRKYLILNMQIAEKIHNYQLKNIFDHLEHASSPVIQVTFEKLKPVFCRPNREKWNEEMLVNIFYYLRHCQPCRPIESLLNHIEPQINHVLNPKILNWKIIKIIAGLEKLGSLAAAERILMNSQQYIAKMQQWQCKHNVDELVRGFSTFPNNAATDSTLVVFSTMIRKNNFDKEDVKKAIDIMMCRPDSNGKSAVIEALFTALSHPKICGK